MKIKNILITSGPTSVPIDEMRVITNRSTGEMGRLIANAFAVKGFRVTLLEGAATTSVELIKKVSVRKFYYFDELAMLLRSELRNSPDVVIHAAAVSDFELARPFRGKVSSGQALSLKLRPTRKLVNSIKRLSPASRLVAFKLEPNFDGLKGKAARLIGEAGADFVVGNKLNKDGYAAMLVRPDGSWSAKVKSKPALVKVLLKEIDSLL